MADKIYLVTADVQYEGYTPLKAFLVQQEAKAFADQCDAYNRTAPDTPAIEDTPENDAEWERYAVDMKKWEAAHPASDGCTGSYYDYSVREVDLAHQVAPARASRQGVACATCNDKGMIGGPSYYAPDEGGEPCPDCTDRQGVALSDEEIDSLWRKHYNENTNTAADVCVREFARATLSRASSSRLVTCPHCDARLESVDTQYGPGTRSLEKERPLGDSASSSRAEVGRDVKMLLDWVEEAVEYVGCTTWSPSLETEGRKILAVLRASKEGE